MKLFIKHLNNYTAKGCVIKWNISNDLLGIYYGIFI